MTAITLPDRMFVQAVRPVRPVRVAVEPPLRWMLSPTEPPHWSAHVRALHAGFFQTALALPNGAPRGVPLYALLSSRTQVLGLALGVATRCRLSLQARHAYFPSLPWLPERTDRDGLLTALLETLRRRGIDEVRFDSFDADWCPMAGDATHVHHQRREYVVPLVDGADACLHRFGASALRGVARGQRERWRIERPAPLVASAMLDTVVTSASARAREHGNGFDAPHWQLPSTHDAESASRLATYAAFRDETLLCAILIGMTPSRAFFLGGGSTPAGYAAGAASWLHWQVMRDLAIGGVATYNLGGIGMPEREPDDRGYGLQRFKLGLGAVAARRHGLHWHASPVHAWLHRLARGVVAAPRDVA